MLPISGTGTASAFTMNHESLSPNEFENSRFELLEEGASKLCVVALYKKMAMSVKNPGTDLGSCNM